MGPPLEETASRAPPTLGCPPKPRPAWRWPRSQASRDIPISFHQVLLGAQAQHIQCRHGHHAGSHRKGPLLELEPPSSALSPGRGLWFLVPGAGLPSDACTRVSPVPGGGDRTRQPPFLPGDLSHFISQAPPSSSPRPGPVGSPMSPASRPQSLGDKSPEGHDHHQGDDGSLQEPLADAGLVWDHRRRLKTKKKGGKSPDLRSPWSDPRWALLEVGYSSPRGAEGEEGETRGWEG